jgi:rRNA maturation endonuclease Nob1
MAFCHKCGEQLPENALFCPKCGTKTAIGTANNTPSPADEMREAFIKISQEMEKAFNIAAREVQEAFQTARNNVQKTINKEPIICASCKEKNQANSAFCFKCGNKLNQQTSKQEDNK